MTRRVAGFLFAVVLAVLSVAPGCVSPAPGGHPDALAEVWDQLAGHDTGAGVPRYDRPAQFGTWRTVNGCDTRQRELAESSATIGAAFDGPDADTCLDDGPVIDYWSGQVIPDPDWRYAQADHVVPLKLLWVGGAHTWTREQRVRAANDPDNVVITSVRTNRDVKSDKGPDEWRPDNPDRWCVYAHDWRLVVDRYRPYGLSWPDEREAAYEAALVDMCPGGTG